MLVHTAPCVCVQNLGAKASPDEGVKRESPDGDVCERRDTRHNTTLHTTLTLTALYFTSKRVIEPNTFASTLLVQSGWCV